MDPASLARDNLPRCERDANNFASDTNGVRSMAAGTGPHAFLDRTLRLPFFDQDIGLPVTTAAPGSNGLRLTDVHAQSVLRLSVSHCARRSANAHATARLAVDADRSRHTSKVPALSRLTGYAMNRMTLDTGT